VTWNWPWASPGATSATDKGSAPLGVIGSANKGPLTINLNAAGLDVVQGWIDEPAKNYGLMIFDTSDDDALEFLQSENADASRRPTLTVTYEP
jgi:hypothetical protein